jgi:predicted TIM-barrel fold metal-dependent hydrolase
MERNRRTKFMKTPFDIKETPEPWHGGKPVTIVSADSHACLPPKQYEQYLDPGYREEFGEYLDDVENHRANLKIFGYPISPEELEVIDTRGAIETGGETGCFDPDRRLRETEAEGIAAEFLHPFGLLAFTPFFDVQNRVCSDELRAAGARAHERFLIEFCSAAPGRLLGVVPVYPWPDWTVAQDACRRAKENGFKAIYPPQQAGVDIPWLYDRWWNPLWEICQELDLAVHIHAGFGRGQGQNLKFTQEVTDALAEATGREGGIAGFHAEQDQTDSILGKVFETFRERRPLWQLMWGGVFDRFPRLKVSFVEIHGDWVPGTLDYLEARYAQGGTPLKMKPSEYWRRHCVVGGSLMRRGEVRARHEIGIDQLMFGTDYPHLESSWPNTLDWLRTLFGDVPEFEARKIMGENAIEFYGLDRELLERTARRVGPYPSELFGNHEIDPKLLRHFNYRAGIDKPAQVEEERLAEAFGEDERAALAAQANVG